MNFVLATKLTSERSSRRWLCTVFLIWKSILLIIALCSPGDGYDSSTELSSGRPLDGRSSSIQNIGHSLIHRLILKLTRWDAIYFVGIAQRNYVYEQEWAFGSAHIHWLRWLACIVPDFLIEGAANRVAFAGITSSHICHLLSVLVLYQLTLLVWSSSPPKVAQQAAALSSILHILNPAGLFLSAPYAEASFSLVTFSGIWLYMLARRARVPASHHLLILGSGICFGVATLFRGNGLLSGLILLYDATASLCKLTRVYFSTKCVDSDELRRFAFTIASGLIMAIIAILPQYQAYQLYCVSATGTLRRPWCNRALPSIYNFVQSEYWNVGIFQYWTISNLPLFLLAAPMLVLLIVSSIDYLSKPQGSTISSRQNTISLPDSTSSSGLSKIIVADLTTPLALPQLTIAILSLTTYHVQIITRLSSGYPIWYWWLTSAMIQNRQVKIAGVDFYLARWAVTWMICYGLIQAVLFASFLPPA